MKKILSIVGARPQFIKAAVVCRALRECSNVTHTLLHTGQHYDANLSDVFFDELDIPAPDFHLGVGSGPHGEQTARILAGAEPILRDSRPDWVVVYGDTNSTLAGAMAAIKLELPVAHVEAGLRSFNRGMPEEINRILADRCSDLLLAPTVAAVEHLQREGTDARRIHLVGDVMYDAAVFYARRARERSTIRKRLELAERGYILATVHRAENTDDPRRLKTVIDGLGLAARQLPVILPLHPRTREAIAQSKMRLPPRMQMIDPVGYLDMVELERAAAVIATDSGGVQKEAFFHRVPCVTLRDETEWTELVEAGWNRLCPPRSSQEIAKTIESAIGSEGTAIQPYGNGHAGSKIADLLRASEAQSEPRP